jgi:hypothetical protein
MSKLPSLAPGVALSPEGLRIVGEALFGAWGWQTRLAEQLEVDGSTVRRWVSGAVSVPGPVKVALRLMLERQGLAPSTRAVAVADRLPAAAIRSAEDQTVTPLRASSSSAKEGWASLGIWPRPISTDTCAALPCRWATSTSLMIL